MFLEFRSGCRSFETLELSSQREVLQGELESGLQCRAQHAADEQQGFKHGTYAVASALRRAGMSPGAVLGMDR